MRMPLTDLAARFCIQLCAIDPMRNCDRRYRIERSIDLFGEQVVELSWGRAGCRHKTKRLSAPNEAQAIRMVRAVLAKRERAPGRIGVAYRSAVVGKGPDRIYDG